MEKVRVAINGFGRIGRAFMRQAWNRPEVDVVAVNDPGSLDNLAYLLTHDTVYGRAPFTVEVKGTNLVVGDKEVRFLADREPTNLPWKDLNIDVVIESTGVFDSYEQASAHLTAGAKRVVISAPAKDEDKDGKGATVLMGVNEDKAKSCPVTSNASCTTNAGSPLIAILDEAIGIDCALLNTTHAYTASQEIVDSTVKGSDYRRGRAGAANISPSSTGAAIAVTKAYPSLAGKFDGISLRVPVPAGSIADITFIAKRDTTAEEVNDILRKAAQQDRWKGIFAASDEQLVSSDIVGESYAAIADLAMTRVVNKRLVKVLSWYDNEAGYTHTLIEHALRAARG